MLDTSHAASPERVSFHAVTRYVQRVLDVHVTAPDSLTDDMSWYSETLARLHCKAAGLTIEQVRSLILTPMVSYACSRGLTVAYHDDFVAKVREGVVVTIVPRKKPETFRKASVRGQKRRPHYAS